MSGERDSIVKSLRWIMMKVGLREQNWPTPEETAVLIQHIESHYGGHTVEEIKLAFDMAISGKLDVDPTCYENFSCLYFSNIMSAYRIWAKQEYEHLPKEQPQIEYKEDLSDLAMIEWGKEITRRLETEPNYALSFIPLGLYEWMDRTGRITKTNAQKREYLEKAVNFRYATLIADAEKQPSHGNKQLLSEFSKMKQQGYFQGDEIKRLKNLAKQIVVKEMIIDEGFRF